MASAAAASDVSDGPILTLVNKRIRNLRKKLNRIAQLEESIAQGKSAIKNKEQEELLKSKPTIVAAVDELEKIRQPLSVAVEEEINLALKEGQGETSENNGKAVNGVSVDKTLDNEQNESDSLVEDLLSIIYFGSMFDYKSQSDFSSLMLTRTHERNCCLAYDYVTDDASTVILGERDLDLISSMGSLLISRPIDSSFSHKDALQLCSQHAKLWLAKSELPIHPNSDVTYASLREKLTNITGSDFFRISPEMKAPVDVAAEAAGNYAFQVPVQVESSVIQHEQKEDDATDLKRDETSEDQSSPVEDSTKEKTEEEISIETPVETQSNKEQFVPRRNHHNQRGGGGGGGRRGGYGNGRGGRSGGRGGPYQNGGGRYQYNDQQGSYYPRNNHGGRGRGGGGRGSGGNYTNGGNNGYNNHHGSVERAES